MYHTYLTMDAFQRLGRGGWDNNWGNATVVIESTSVFGAADTDFAFFRESPPTATMPPGAAVYITRAVRRHNLASSLDLLAHEWGHGVLYTDVGFNYASQVGAEMEEGWADVIGTIVEKLQQQPGNGLEQSNDWTMHEDSAGPSGGYARGAVDDGAGGHIFSRTNGTVEPVTKDRIHRDDPDVTGPGFPHTQGNMLVMAMRLIAEGGKNPICTRLPALLGCSDPAVVALGQVKARKIMWDTVTNQITGSTTWATVANDATRAAEYAYRRCPGYSGLVEQNAVQAAFKAIGYPATVAPRGCP